MTTYSSAPDGASDKSSDRLHTLADLFEKCFIGPDCDVHGPPHLLGASFQFENKDQSTRPNNVDSGLLFKKTTTADGDNVSVFMKMLDCHPAQELMGWRAPEHWWCLGVASGGWAGRCEPDSSGLPRLKGADRQRVRVLHLVSRDTGAINVLRRGDEVPIRTSWTGPSTAYSGMLDDCLRRSLGIATSPAPDTSIEFWTLSWIDSVLEAAADGRLDGGVWRDVAALHPVFDFTGGLGDPEVLRWGVDNLARAGEILAAAYPWTRVRDLSATESAAGGGRFRPIEPDVLEWMDLGMFARNALGAFPPLSEAARDLFELLGAETHTRLVQTLSAWGLKLTDID